MDADLSDPQLQLRLASLGNLQRDGDQFVVGLNKVPDGRGHAMVDDQNARRAGAAMVRAFLAAIGKLSIIDTALWIKFLSRIGEKVDSMTQRHWRPGPEQPLPKMWVDEVTGQTLPNPWQTGDERGKTILRLRDPALAAFLEKFASSPYDTLASMADGKEQRQRLRDAVYARKEHDGNPWRGAPDMAAQTAFVKEYPALVESWRWEAKTPVTLPWSAVNPNRTELGRVLLDLRANPVEGLDETVVQLAQRVDAALVDNLRKQAAEDEKAAQRRRRELGS